jgi:hypothetical protein
MSRNLNQINTTDTFQVWLQRTNELVSELGTTVVTASALGDTTAGNATLIGSFTANTVTAITQVRTNLIDTKVGNTNPIEFRGMVDFTSVASQLPVTIRNSLGPRIRIQNNNIAWQMGLRGSSGTGTNAQFVIGVEGSDFALRIGSDGIVRANTIYVDSDSSNASSVLRAGRTITTNNGITGGGALTNDLTIGLTGNALALHQLTDNGFVARVGTGSVEARTLQPGTGISISNGSGVSGNPSIAVDSTVVRTTGNQEIGGIKTFSSDILVGNTAGSQVLYGEIEIACSPYHESNESMRINYTSPSNQYFRSLNIFNGKTELIAEFDGPTSSILVGPGVLKTQIKSNQINASPSDGSVRALALNFTTSTNAFRNVDIYDGKEFLFARFVGSSRTLEVIGDITAFSTAIASDIRLKSNVRTIDNALNKVLNLRGVHFEMEGKSQIGVIAQEVETVIPEVVSNSGDYKTVAYANLVGLLIEAVKELSKQVEELKAKS